MTEESPLIGSRAFKIVPLAGFSGGRLQTRIPGAETLIYLIRKKTSGHPFHWLYSLLGSY